MRMANPQIRWATPADVDRVLDLLDEYHRQEGLRGHSRDRIRTVLEDLFEFPSKGRVVLAERGVSIARSSEDEVEPTLLSLSLDFDDEADTRALERIVSALVGAGFGVQEAAPRRPALDDVFRALTRPTIERTVEPS